MGGHDPLCLLPHFARRRALPDSEGMVWAHVPFVFVSRHRPSSFPYRPPRIRHLRVRGPSICACWSREGKNTRTPTHLSPLLHTLRTPCLPLPGSSLLAPRIPCSPDYPGQTPTQQSSVLLLSALRGVARHAGNPVGQVLHNVQMGRLDDQHPLLYTASQPGQFFPTLTAVWIPLLMSHPN